MARLHLPRGPGIRRLEDRSALADRPPGGAIGPERHAEQVGPVGTARLDEPASIGKHGHQGGVAPAARGHEQRSRSLAYPEDPPEPIDPEHAGIAADPAEGHAAHGIAKHVIGRGDERSHVTDPEGVQRGIEGHPREGRNHRGDRTLAAAGARAHEHGKSQQCTAWRTVICERGTHPIHGSGVFWPTPPAERDAGGARPGVAEHLERRPGAATCRIQTWSGDLAGGRPSTLGFPLPRPMWPRFRRGARVLEVRDVTKRYDGRAVVNRVSFEVRPGEVFALLGPNGAGKTTLIRMITDILRPDSGTIHLDGQPIDQAKRTIAYLPEERGLYRRSRVIDVLSYYGRLKGMSTRNALEASFGLLKRVELAEWSA
ncbi:MAG: ATP-binding cassette domain-containing protein, partial [Candidatus Eisenbacteria bacterium]